jgi:hypothetical protein
MLTAMAGNGTRTLAEAFVARSANLLLVVSRRDLPERAFDVHAEA